MDTQTIITTLLGLVLAGVGWWVKNIWAMVMAQQAQIVALQVELGKSYMPRAEVQEALKRIFDLLDEIRKDMK